MVDRRGTNSIVSGDVNNTKKPDEVTSSGKINRADTLKDTAR
jgi:hypothetical protein